MRYFLEVNMNQNANRYLAEEKIGKLLLKFSIPCIMSLLVSALYNIVDQILSEEESVILEMGQQMLCSQ